MQRVLNQQPENEALYPFDSEEAVVAFSLDRQDFSRVYKIGSKWSKRMARGLTQHGMLHHFPTEAKEFGRHQWLREHLKTRCCICGEDTKWLTEFMGCCDDIDFEYLPKKDVNYLQTPNSSGTKPVHWLYKVWLEYGGSLSHMSASRA